MNVLATLLLPAAMTGLEVEFAALPPENEPTIAVAVLYPPDDPEGPDDAGTGEGEGSGGSAGGE